MASAAAMAPSPELHAMQGSCEDTKERMDMVLRDTGESESGCWGIARVLTSVGISSMCAFIASSSISVHEKPQFVLSVIGSTCI